MSYATVAELKALLAAPVAGAGTSSGMISSTGAAVTGVRWDDTTLQTQLDIASAYLDGVFGAMVTIGAANAVAKGIVLHLAAASVLRSCLPESLEGEGKTRAGQYQSVAERMIAEVKRSPWTLGAAKAPVAYV